MALRLNSSQKAMLISLVDSTALAPVFVTKGPDAELLSKNDLALFDANKVDADGKIAGVLTEIGQKKAKTYKPTDPENKRTPLIAADTVIEIEEVAKFPEFKPRGGSGARAVYPFDKMTKPGVHTFFIPSPEQDDDGVQKTFKRVQSSITSHNAKLRKAADAARAADPTAPDPHEFKVGEDAKNGQKGVRVYMVK